MAVAVDMQTVRGCKHAASRLDQEIGLLVSVVIVVVAAVVVAGEIKAGAEIRAGGAKLAAKT